jgi:hypothetical protein
MSDATDRIPYDTGSLEDMLGVAAVGLAQWETRDETRAQPHLRHAAGDALAAIDEMLAALHVMRVRLVSEMRVSDDIAMGRSAELLERAREDGPGLVCPGCGSPDVDLSRGPLCGTCAEAAAEEAGDDG